MIILPEDRPKLDLKNKQANTLDKINQILADIKKEQPSTNILNSNDKEIAIIEPLKNHLIVIHLLLKI